MTVDRSVTTIRAARSADYSAVCDLLDEAGLPRAGVPDDLREFVVAERDGRVVAAAGLEPFGSAALLRSVVVSPSERGTGIGHQLVETALGRARGAGAREVFLLTTTADRWFPRFGFAAVAREVVPGALSVSEEFRGACPASAVVMRLSLA